MSFRLHSGPRLLTIFHDASSPSSQRILSLLQARAKASEVTPVRGNGTGAADQQEGQAGQHSPARKYLDSASLQQPSSAPFELEVVDRAKATSDQWNTIGSYLSKNKRSEVETLKDEQGAIVVDWTGGQAVQTEELVEALVNRLTKQSGTSAGRADGSSSCIVS